jgi:hypothetical protein
MKPALLQRCRLPLCTLAALLVCTPPAIHAQQRGRQVAPPITRANAPIDLTGDWVSVVTEDWRWRMVTPPKGDVSSIPLNNEGRRVANTWDPAKDEAAGTQCKAYGAPAIMRVPGRVHITWENDSTLRIDTDAGMQTRLFHFSGSVPKGGEPAWQGHSVAQWEVAGGRGETPRAGNLKVVTTRMRPGYLRKNGVPYSENTVLTEYFHRMVEPNGDGWLLVMSIVEDPQYLAQPFITTTQFKKVPDRSGWNPTPCSAR